MFFLSSSYLESSDWALGPTYAQIRVAWPFTPTIAPRDPFFLLHGGKGGSRCDSCALFIIPECEASFELSKPCPWRFGTQGVLSLNSHGSMFLILNDAMRIQWLEGFIRIWAGFVPPITLCLLFWISWELVPTRLRLLYKEPRGIILPHFCRFLSSREIPSSPFLPIFLMTLIGW